MRFDGLELIALALTSPYSLWLAPARVEAELEDGYPILSGLDAALGGPSPIKNRKSKAPAAAQGQPGWLEQGSASGVGSSPHSGKGAAGGPPPRKR